MIGRLMAVAAFASVATLTQAAPAKKPIRAAAARDWTRTVVATPAGGALIGNPGAAVKLIEYGSRTCPHCAHFAAEGLPALKANYIASGKVSYEFRDFPIHNAVDLGPILLGRCVPVAKFFPLLDAMMAEQANLSGRAAELSVAEQERLAKATPNQVAASLARFYGYVDFVAKRGVSAARAKACLADKKALDLIVRRAGDAENSFKVASTPTFIIDGKVAEGVGEWVTLEPALRAALAK